MITTTPFLDTYKRCMEEGQLTKRNGLCHEIDADLQYNILGAEHCVECFNEYELRLEILDHLHPEKGDTHTDDAYWGSDIPYIPKEGSKLIRCTDFGLTRQDILLWCAAINNEL